MKYPATGAVIEATAPPAEAASWARSPSSSLMCRAKSSAVSSLMRICRRFKAFCRSSFSWEIWENSPPRSAAERLFKEV